MKWKESRGRKKREVGKDEKQKRREIMNTKNDKEGIGKGWNRKIKIKKRNEE